MTPSIVESPGGPVVVSKRQLHGLLLANQIVTSELSLPAVLRRIVEAACQLVDARYGALGVIGADCELEQFIHVGMDDAVAARISHRPRGEGILGMLIHHPQAIRLDDLHDSPDAVGLPPNHPPMKAFLGVPVRVRDTVFGNLYLTEPASGTFSSEDEELVAALAAAAGVAIDNARLYDEARRGQAWLRASADITRELLSHDHSDPLAVIVERAQELADADAVSVMLPTDSGRLRAAVAIGVGADHFRGLVFEADSNLGKAVATGDPLLYADLDELASDDYENPFDLGPLMVAPLADAQGVRGALLLARIAGRAVFTSAELEMAATFANHVALALELSDAREDAERVSLLEDRDRIARDLHDHVIQRLFATGLGLEGLATGSRDERLARRLADHVSDLDETIRQIRASIFELQHGLHGGSIAIRARLLELADASTRMLGFRPTMKFSGPVDTVITGALAEDVMAVAREALSNVGRHAHASHAELCLTASAAVVVLEVADDGVGIAPDRGPESGLENIRRRAVQRGGFAALAKSRMGGVLLHWESPLDSAH